MSAFGTSSWRCEGGCLFRDSRSLACISKVASVKQCSFSKFLRPPEVAAQIFGKSFSNIPHGHASNAYPYFRTRMALVDDTVFHQKGVKKSGVLAYELVQGSHVRWNSVTEKSVPDLPTAVFLHGILGGRKNWVDLRCHGDSAQIKKHEPHTVASAALDVLQLVNQLRITPRVLVGHSFGGKVVLSMVEQAAKPLARPVRVWVLDATPGKVRTGGDGEDRPGELIAFLQSMPKQVASKQEVVSAIVQEGFSADVAQWVVTNLHPISNDSSISLGFSWVFDLDGIAEMYRSYETTNLWKIVENVPSGVHMNFLKAERSLHRWALEDLQRIHAAEELASNEGAGVKMHVLEDAGHWVHADNPDGLFKILSKSFRGTQASKRALEVFRPQ